ncbi:restin homolog isoform X2 [Larimichthys crocea]|uniref:restin homolog isoform X2 n=1 Tax=Larimichthys crocea TaxID=215358 RepID=UPI000F5EC0B5|nr:restin homolog isoform X2 [Larimichthys crocea]
MAGDSRFIWFPILLSCVFQVSDHRHVPGDAKIVVLKNPGVDNIFSKIPIILPDGIDPKNINVTSITLKTCTGVEERLTLLNSQLQQKTVRNRQLDNEAFGLRREVRMLKLQLAACSATASAVAGSYQTQLQSKMEQLLQRLDGDTFLILKTIALTRDVNSLQKKITLASNSIERTTEIRVLQGKLQEKTSELNVTMQRIVRNTNGLLILQIISLQNQIWDLEQAKSSRGEASFQPDRIILGLQENLNRKLTQLQSTGDASSIMLELISVHSKIAETERLIGVLIEQSKTKSIDYQRQWMQKVNLLRKKVLQLNHDENNIDLTKEIFQLQTEMDNFRQLMLNAKNTTDTILEEQRVNLEVWKKQQENLQEQLQKADYAQAQRIMNIITIMKEVRGLKVDEQDQTTSTKSKCSGIELMYAGVKTEFEQNIAELKRAGDSKAALILKVINLHDELKTLKKLISTTNDLETISALQRQLEERQLNLNSTTTDIERLIANPKTILTIIEVQNEIWDLEKKPANETNSEHLKELQDRVDGLITEIDENESTKLLLKIITLQSQVEHLLKQLSEHQEGQNTQTTQLNNDLSTKNEELQKMINDLNEKHQKNAALILTVTDLQKQLKNLEEEKFSAGQKDSATITKLREQLKKKEEEHTHDQTEIKALQNQLNQTEARCSGINQKLNELQNDLDAKMKELESKSDTVASLALQVSTLTVQLEELKRQLQNTQSETKIKELQKIIDEKTNELAKKTEELKAKSTQSQRILQIVAIQTEIEKLVNVAKNDTDYVKIAALEDQLKYLVDGIQDENNENTKLMFKILAQQDEIARLKKQEESQIKADLQKIKVLENELDDIRNQIKEKTILIGSSDTRISDLTAQILELQRKIKPLEDEILTLKEENAEKTKELQERLDLSKKQLQDSELLLKEADTKNFNMIMEIADLRTKLKKAQREASKAAKKNIDELEQQIQTQQAEIEQLEKTNKDLKQEVEELKTCRNDVNAQCTDIQTKLEQSQEDANRIEQQLHEKENILQEQLQQLQDLALEHNNLQNEYSNLENKQHQTQKFADDLKQQLVDKDGNLNQLEQELEEQRRENKRLEDENNRLQNKLNFVEDKTIHPERITLDPNTANPRIVLSADNTEIITTANIQNIPDHPDQFDVVLGVMGKTGWSTGRHYWEVSVGGQRCYHIGMASESAQRKGAIRFSPSNGFWTIILNKQGQYRAIDVTNAIIPVQTKALTLGILLDYNKGQISFYDAGVRSHMYTFVGQSFTGKIYPFINICVDGGHTPIYLLTPGSTEWIK